MNSQTCLSSHTYKNVINIHEAFDFSLNFANFHIFVELQHECWKIILINSILLISGSQLLSN